MTVTIYHHPGCGTSRRTLELLREAGVEPLVIEYMVTPPSRATLIELVAASGLPVRAMMRQKEALYGALGLDAADRTDDELLDAMVAHPILMNRPLVVKGTTARLCRPAETVHEVLGTPGAPDTTARV